MFTRRSIALGLLMSVSALLVTPAVSSAETKEAKAGTIEEMRAHRRTLREDLMFPSLKGIRGLAYGVPGTHPEEDLDKVVEARLKELPIVVKRFQDCEPGVTKPIDGFLQVKVLGAGDRFSVVELTLTQWCALDRDPNIHVRTITYNDQAVSNHKLVKHTVESLLNQFVIDYMKANGDSKAGSGGQASDDGNNKKSEKESKKDKKKKS